jgi:hypothetical protein
MNLINGIKVTRVLAAVAVGTSAQSGTVLDMSGFDGVLFVLPVGTITDGGVVLKAQQGAVSDGSDAADLAGTATTLANTDDGDVAILDLYRPTARYVRAVAVRGGATGAVLDGLIAIQYKAIKQPTVQDATSVHASKLVVSPALGTP